MNMPYRTPMGSPMTPNIDPGMYLEMQNQYDVASGGYRPPRIPGNKPPMKTGEWPLPPWEQPASPPNPMGGGNMSGPVATFPNTTPMGGGGVGNYPLHPTPMSTPNINRNPDFGNWPGNMQSPTTIPGGPLQESPLQAPNFPAGGPGMGEEPSWPSMGGSPGMGGGGYQKPPSSPTGGTYIPGGPLQESPLGGGMPGVRAGEGGQMGGGMSRPRTGGRRMPTGGGQVIDGGWDRGQRQGGNNQGGMGAQRSYSSSYNPNTNRNRNTTSGRSGGRRGFAARGNSMPATYNNPNRYSTGGNMNANRLGSRAYGRRQGSASPSSSRYNPFFASGRYQPRSGRGSYDTGGLYSPGGHYDRYPRSPGMPSVTNRNTYNTRTYNTNRNYDQRKTYNTQTFNEGDTSIQGPRIAKKMGRMQGYNPMMHGSQSRQIGGLRNLQRMLAAMRGGRR